jgi:hypothetical protein
MLYHIAPTASSAKGNWKKREKIGGNPVTIGLAFMTLTMERIFKLTSRNWIRDSKVRKPHKGKAKIISSQPILK